MIKTLTILFCLTVLMANAQQPPTGSAASQETIITLPIQNCGGGSCTATNYQLVLDADYRGFTDCSVPEGAGATNCVLDASQYSGVSITPDGNGVTFSNQRLLVLDPLAGQYEIFRLLGQEISFDVDVSQVTCGDVSALYMVGMQADGTSSTRNTAGAKWGTGYCDAQCLKSNFVDGYFAENNNSPQAGACCSEMDIWEGNKEANALTTHSCGSYQDCGLSNTPSCNSIAGSSTCDSSGCQVNPYKDGDKSFYGPSSSNAVDTTSPFTVVTQFYTTNGALSSIQRYYVQNGVQIGSPYNITGSCSSSFPLSSFGSQLANGMVMVLSAYGADDAWLDGDTYQPNGPCTNDPYSTNPVTFSNIKYGPIGSTSGAPTSTTGSSSSTTTGSTTPSPITTAITPAPTTTSAPTTTPAPSTTGGGNNQCTQYQVQDIMNGTAWNVGQEWNFNLLNSGSSTPSSVVLSITVPSGDTPSNPGNMQSQGNNLFSIDDPSSLTPGTSSGYSFQVNVPAGATHPTPSIAVYSCS